MAYWFPYFTYELKSDLDKDQLISQLSQNIRNSTSMIDRAKSGKVYFRGSIKENKFKLIPILDHRNSFKPIIYGRIKNFDIEGTTLQITMSLHPLVITFLTVWITFVVLINNQIFWSIGIFVFIYLITFIFFNLAVDKIEVELDKVLQKNSP